MNMLAVAGLSLVLFASKPLNMELMELEDGIQIAITGSFKSAKVFKFGNYLVVDISGGRPSTRLPKEANFCGARITVEDMRKDFGVIRFTVKPPSPFSYTYRKVSNAIIVKLNFKKQKVKSVEQKKKPSSSPVAVKRKRERPKKEQKQTKKSETVPTTAVKTTPNRKSKPKAKPAPQVAQPKPSITPKSKEQKLSVAVYGARIELFNIALSIATGDTTINFEGPERVFLSEPKITLDSLKKILKKSQK